MKELVSLFIRSKAEVAGLPIFLEIHMVESFKHITSWPTYIYISLPNKYKRDHILIISHQQSIAIAILSFSLSIKSNQSLDSLLFMINSFRYRIFHLTQRKFRREETIVSRYSKARSLCNTFGNQSL
jgi:hypothetical protein